MQAHAERSYPNECCGLLVGKIENGMKHVLALHSVENSWNSQIASHLQDETTTPTRRYWIEPETMLLAMRQARQQNLDIIGVYHSHPDHPAVPSECDRQLAWSTYSYIILSVMQGKAGEFYSWNLNEQHQFCSEAIAIQEEAIVS
jgi:proteasome lid subunit RPN8/RPN11